MPEENLRAKHALERNLVKPCARMLSVSVQAGVVPGILTSWS